MDPLEAPLPGLQKQTSDNTAWMEDLEESFFTVPPASPRFLLEDELDDETEEILYQASSPWPARLFLGACVGGVIAVAVGVFAPAFFAEEPLRYAENEVISEVGVGEANAPVRKSVRIRRTRKAARSPVRAPAVRPPPQRVDSLPPLSVASLKPGATL